MRSMSALVGRFGFCHRFRQVGKVFCCFLFAANSFLHVDHASAGNQLSNEAKLAAPSQTQYVECPPEINGVRTGDLVVITGKSSGGDSMGAVGNVSAGGGSASGGVSALGTGNGNSQYWRNAGSGQSAFMKAPSKNDADYDCKATTKNPVVIGTGEKIKDELDFGGSGVYGISLSRTYRSIHSAASCLEKTGTAVLNIGH